MLHLNADHSGGFFMNLSCFSLQPAEPRQVTMTRVPTLQLLVPVTCGDVDRGPGLGVGLVRAGAGHHAPPQHRQQPLVAVLVRPHGQVHPVPSQHTLQTVDRYRTGQHLGTHLEAPQFEQWQASPGSGLELGAVVPIVVGAVHGPVPVHHHPGGRAPVNPGQVLLQPVILPLHLTQPSHN